jgi:hypothetical protein
MIQPNREGEMVMKIVPGMTPIISGVMSTFILLLVSWNLTLVASAQNIEPELSEAGAYFQEGEAGDEYFFTIVYTDADGDEGTVLLYIESHEPYTMRTLEPDPIEGQYYEVVISDITVEDSFEFYYTADDGSGNITQFPPESEDPLLFGDFDGWGEQPILSSAGVYFDGDDWVFNVTYQDPDGDKADGLDLVLNDEIYISMGTSDSDPFVGQNYSAKVLETTVNNETEFYFSVDDVNGSYSSLYDDDGSMFVVRDLLSFYKGVKDDNGGGNGGGEPKKDDGNSDGGSLEGWSDNPEVLVGIIGILIIIAGSAFGVYRRRKKQGRFSDLLTKLDDVYGTYKMSPKRCETELEKMKVTINEDLKKGVIDENNYTILKNRIDEILGEIRSEAIRSEVSVLPKDIELKIKDMLIDGKITREEYDKILPAIKGSTMANEDKEKMRKMVKSWVKKD